MENYIHLSGHPFEVIRLTNDEDIIGCYYSIGKNYTPTKVITCSIFLMFHSNIVCVIVSWEYKLHANVDSICNFQCIIKQCVDEISPVSALIPGANYGFGRFPSFGSSPSGFDVDASARPSTGAPPSVPMRDLLPTFHELISVDEAAWPSVWSLVCYMYWIVFVWLPYLYLT